MRPPPPQQATTAVTPQPPLSPLMTTRQKNDSKEGDEYISCLQSNNVKLSNLTLFEFPDTGRGVKSLSPVASGTQIAVIPHNMLISSRVVRVLPHLKPVFHFIPKISDDDSLAVFLMYERQFAASTVTSTTASNWTQHIKAQPQSYTNVLFFSPEELKALKGSNLCALSERLLKQVSDDYKEVFPKLLQKFSKVFDPAYFSLDAYKWALSTIWSRAFDLEIKEGKRERVLVPFGDMFNHSFDAQVDHHFDSATNSLVFTSVKPIAEDSQVFICYDPTLTNERLLRLYGFCLPDNIHDLVHIYAHISPSIPRYDWKVKCLAKNGVEAVNSTGYPIPMSGEIPPTLLSNMRIQYIEEDETPNARQAFQPDGIVSPKNETLVLNSVFNALKEMLSEYSTTCEEDERKLEELRLQNINNNTTNILLLHIGEKKILTKAIQVATKMRFDLALKLLNIDNNESNTNAK
jgi:hypothetical protein